jgi:hypothetical protein
VQSRIEQTVGTGGGDAALARSTQPPTSNAGWYASPLVKGVLVLALGVVGVSVAQRFLSQPETSARAGLPVTARTEIPRPTTVAIDTASRGARTLPLPPPVQTPEEAAPAVAIAPQVERTSLVTTGKPGHLGRDRDLAIERALLDEVRGALARRDGAGAVASAEQHAQRFPRGRLAEERESMWVQALVFAGEIEEAQVRAARFRRRYPSSLFLPVVDAALGRGP